MKKLAKSCLFIALGLFMSVNVMADVQTGKTGPDYPTDYYMIVESKAGGIDIYSQPDLESTRLNDEQIPNGTALHIEGEVEDTENNRTWGYTEYHGMYGYAPLDECRPADSRKEAIDSELYIAGKDQVNYNADYDVNAYAEEGSQKLYQGPGTKYGEVPGVRDIENGETLHITQDAEMVDGSHWGVTDSDGTEGGRSGEKRRMESRTSGYCRGECGCGGRGKRRRSSSDRRDDSYSYGRCRRYSIKDTMEELAKNPEAMEIASKAVKLMANMIVSPGEGMWDMMKSMSFERLSEMAGDLAPEGFVESVNAKLIQIKKA
mgnify:CR=1 FL=1